MSQREDFDWTGPGLYRAVVEQLAEAVIVVDPQGRVRLWNAGATAVFGYEADEMLGGQLDPIIPERLRAAHQAGFERAVTTGQTKHAGRALTTRAVHKDGGKRYVEMSFVLLRDALGGVAGVAAIGRDCTQRHLAGSAHEA